MVLLSVSLTASCCSCRGEELAELHSDCTAPDVTTCVFQTLLSLSR